MDLVWIGFGFLWIYWILILKQSRVHKKDFNNVGFPSYRSQTLEVLGMAMGSWSGQALHEASSLFAAEGANHGWIWKEWWSSEKGFVSKSECSNSHRPKKNLSPGNFALAFHFSKTPWKYHDFQWETCHQSFAAPHFWSSRGFYIPVITPTNFRHHPVKRQVLKCGFTTSETTWARWQLQL